MSRKSRVVIFGGGNRVQKHILPALDRKFCDVTIVRRKPSETIDTFLILYADFDFLSSAPDIAIVSTPGLAKVDILKQILDAGWQGPVLADNPSTGLEGLSCPNLYSLEGSFFDVPPAVPSKLDIARGSVPIVLGALQRGHGLPAFSSALCIGRVPNIARVFFSLFGFSGFKKHESFRGCQRLKGELF